MNTTPLKIQRGKKEYYCITANADFTDENGNKLHGHIVFMEAEPNDKVLENKGIDPVTLKEVFEVKSG